jgi:drug/metabolite transporter (DMT)-like permease
MTLGDFKTDRGGHTVRGTGLLLLAFLFWGSSAPLAKYLMVARFDIVIIAQTRVSLSFILLCLFFFFFNRKVFKIDKKDLWHFVILGVAGLAVTNYTYYFTVKESTVATAILIQYTAPLWVVLAAVYVTKEESLNLMITVALVTALFGCYCAVSGGRASVIQLHGWTWLTGPVSAFTFAFQIIATKHLLKKYSLWTVILYMFGFASLFWLFINPPWVIASKMYTLNDWIIFWIFAVVSILIPQSAFAAGLKWLKASTAGIIGTMEPVVAITVAYFLLGESLHPIQIAGGILVVAAVTMLQIHPLIQDKRI